ncbi:C40 family peptidase [Pseudomonas nitroreducens]|uniref:C40 family peptidase n=1 Tax=Pseudomonas nitroreducens TaxID=46680 RepID=UPI002447F41F|nr:NlpC/P60 family protein [Pseudomonas nitroreducens]MDG9855598.1 C40 family peptidase [Pseudomonas nitroreducens]
MTRDDIVSTALLAEGTPFKHQGRIAGLGMDCAGLYVFICQSLDIPHQDATGYPRTPFGGELERQLDGQPALWRVPVEEAGKGDILVMRMTKQPQHIAIHAGDEAGYPCVIHASEMHGKVCHHRIDELWRARVVRAYRFSGVEQ